jgi:hypothetical protein
VRGDDDGARLVDVLPEEDAPEDGVRVDGRHLDPLRLRVRPEVNVIIFNIFIFNSLFLNTFIF